MAYTLLVLSQEAYDVRKAVLNIPQVFPVDLYDGETFSGGMTDIFHTSRETYVYLGDWQFLPAKLVEWVSLFENEPLFKMYECWETTVDIGRHIGFIPEILEQLNRGTLGAYTPHLPLKIFANFLSLPKDQVDFATYYGRRGSTNVPPDIR